jgi:hypothetical protein
LTTDYYIASNLHCQWLSCSSEFGLRVRYPRFDLLDLSLDLSDPVVLFIDPGVDTLPVRVGTSGISHVLKLGKIASSMVKSTLKSIKAVF